MIVDLHCHVLPGVDDGPASLDETEALLQEADEAGIETIVCTSHMFHPSFQARSAAEMRREFASLQADLGERGTPHLVLGAENFASEEFFQALARSEVLTLNDHDCLLLEFSPYMSVDQIQAGAGLVLDGGLRPVLAHIERYPALMSSEDALESLVQSGCVLQINAQSLLRFRAPGKLRRKCHRLLDRGLVHIVASDSHGAGSSTPLLAEARRQLARKHSDQQALAWTYDNPGRLISGSAPA